MADIDFDLGETASDEPSMERLVSMAKEVIETERLVEDLEDNLADLKKRLNKMKTVDLPDMMAECGLSEFKTEVNLQFGKSEHNQAWALVADLADKGYNVGSKMGIHPQTLIAHIKERLKSGDEVPLELLGLYAGRIAKIKPAKK